MLAAFKETERKAKEQGVKCRTERENMIMEEIWITIFQNQGEATVLTL